ncbi:MAG: zinc ribbon domain-containing protein [Planctomycetota bacterium]|nr:zinc ribbon domain-containing protein [Planctomycetota bacterium]MDI6788679.1 zinc ribbon domain-containing protein [Planctomycetota bacterium]
MALIKCTECGQEISDMATACPKCGKPTEEAIIEQEVQVEKRASILGERIGTIVGAIIVFLLLLLFLPKWVPLWVVICMWICLIPGAMIDVLITHKKPPLWVRMLGWFAILLGGLSLTEIFGTEKPFIVGFITGFFEGSPSLLSLCKTETETTIMVMVLALFSVLIIISALVISMLGYMTYIGALIHFITKRKNKKEEE